MDQKKYITVAFACMIVLAAAAEDTTRYTLEVKEESQLFVQVTAVDGDVVTGEIGSLVLLEDASVEQMQNLPWYLGEGTEQQEDGEEEKSPEPAVSFESSGEVITFVMEEKWQQMQQMDLTAGMVLLVQLDEAGKVVMASPAANAGKKAVWLAPQEKEKAPKDHGADMDEKNMFKEMLQF